MRSLKKASVAAVLAMSCQSLFAGGLLTNTNQNIAFNRNFARDGVIAIDGVYSNPAGIAFLEKVGICLLTSKTPTKHVPFKAEWQWKQLNLLLFISRLC